MAEDGEDSRRAGDANGNPRHLSSPPKSPPHSQDHEEKATHVRFLLSNAEAGSVIGKGGSTISDFQSQSGARIQLSRNFECFPGTYDRIAMVSGTVDDVLKGVKLILTKLLDEFYVEEGGNTDLSFRTRLVVPNGSCGGIIGKGGSIIKSFIEESRASVKISPLDDSYPGLYDRIVTVNGKLGEQMRAIELILLKLINDPLYGQSAAAPFLYAGLVGPYNNGMYYHNAAPRKFPNGRLTNKDEKSSSVTIGVPDEHIGLVVGRGGRNIVEISQVSGARIKISERGDFMSATSSDRKVTITGSQKSIRIAESLIYGKVPSAADQ